jgi:hypothetical protein
MKNGDETHYIVIIWEDQDINNFWLSKLQGTIHFSHSCDYFVAFKSYYVNDFLRNRF